MEAELLRQRLLQRKISTMPELKAALGRYRGRSAQAARTVVGQEYPTGVKITDPWMAGLALVRHKVQRLQNYTIHPRP